MPKGKGGNVRVAYLKINNPASKIDVDRVSKDFSNLKGKERELAITKQLKKEGFDGIVAKSPYIIDQYIAFDPDQIIPAFGEGNINQIAKQIDVENGKQIKQSVEQVNDPTNTTAVDDQEIQTFDNFEQSYPKDLTTEQVIELEEEVAMLKEQGLLDREDLAILEDLEEFNIDDFNAGLDSAYICLTRG